MKEVARTAAGAKAIYLSDGTINLGLIKDSPVPGQGLQVLGFQVRSVQEIEERLKKPLALTYKGEAPLQLKKTSDGVYNLHLLDPNGIARPIYR